MYKLIACDMDETLLDNYAKVSAENRNAIDKARQAGIRFVLSSGRGYLAMQTTNKALNLYDKEDEYTISFNGGVITENKDNRVLMTEGISFSQLQTLFDIGVKFDVEMHIYTLDKVYIYRIQEDDRKYLKGRLDDYIEFEDADINFLKDQNIIKILYFNLDQSLLKTIKDTIPKHIQDQYSITYSANRYLEFNQKGISKGSGLLTLLQKLNIKPEEVIAIGDSNNDVSMLNVAGLAVAVANASPEMKEAADYITNADHNNSAIAEVIEKFILKQ
ncbi:Cof-type HAD-IIB family hydrolase [Orbaceae bacterium ac157xtp]